MADSGRPPPNAPTGPSANSNNSNNERRRGWGRSRGRGNRGATNTFGRGFSNQAYFGAPNPSGRGVGDRAQFGANNAGGFTGGYYATLGQGYQPAAPAGSAGRGNQADQGRSDAGTTPRGSGSQAQATQSNAQPQSSTAQSTSGQTAKKLVLTLLEGEYMPPNRDYTDQSAMPRDMGYGPKFANCLDCAQPSNDGHVKAGTGCANKCVRCNVHHHGRPCPNIYASRTWWKRHGPHGRLPTQEERAVGDMRIRPNTEEAAELIARGYTFFKDLPDTDKGLKRSFDEVEGTTAAANKKLKLDDSIRSGAEKKLRSHRSELKHQFRREQETSDELRAHALKVEAIDKKFQARQTGLREAQALMDEASAEKKAWEDERVRLMGHRRHQLQASDLMLETSVEQEAWKAAERRNAQSSLGAAREGSSRNGETVEEATPSVKQENVEEAADCLEDTPSIKEEAEDSDVEHSKLTSIKKEDESE